MKKNLMQVIKKNSISLDEFAKSLTPKELIIAEQKIKYYDILLELKKTRLKIGYTQQELADRASLPRTTITKIESGKHNPTLDTLMTIASAMDKQIQVQVV